MVFVAKVTAFGANPGAGDRSEVHNPGHIADTIINLGKRRHRLAEIMSSTRLNATGKSGARTRSTLATS